MFGRSEQLTALLTNIITNPERNIQMAQTNLDQEDNEMVVQTLLTTFSTVSAVFLEVPGIPINYLFDGINVAFSFMGYMMHTKQIARSELKDYIYYSRLTLDGQVMLSNYHPLHLMTFMEEMEIPKSFKKLHADQDYLPNLYNVWDRGNPESLLLISFQRVNLHFTEEPGRQDPVNISGPDSSRGHVPDLD
jgi:hypothetical protein